MTPQPDLNFTLLDVSLVEFEAKLGNVLGEGEADVAIDYQIPVASYRAGTTNVLIETEYTVKVSPSAKLRSMASDDGLIAFMRSRMRVVMHAGREVTEEDALTGGLDSAQAMANNASHPYHRQQLAVMTSSLGLPPYPLPITFEVVLQEINGSP